MIVGVTFSPEAAPGCCKLCGGADKEWYLDMGYSEEFYGAVYFCNECISHVADVCGFAPPVVREQLDKKLATLEDQVFDYKTKNEGLEQALDGLLRARFVERPDPAPLLLPPDVEVVGEDAGDPSPSGDGVGEGEGETPEPLHDEGVGQLRSDERDDGFELDLP